MHKPLCCLIMKLHLSFEVKRTVVTVLNRPACHEYVRWRRGIAPCFLGVGTGWTRQVSFTFWLLGGTRKILKSLRIMWSFELGTYQVQSNSASQSDSMFGANISHTHRLCVCIII
jgi:hypothetical protein